MYRLRKGILILFIFIIYKSSFAAATEKIAPVKQDSTLYAEAVRFLSQYLRIASVSGEEKNAADFLSNYCSQKGLHVKIFSNTDSGYNFTASLYPLSSGKPNILFLNHIDVVAAGDTSMWVHPPFSGFVDDSAIWGRGALDAKGLAVMQLMAILHFKTLAAENELPYNVTLLAVSGEETGGKNGAAFITEKYLSLLKPVVVFGEGGSGIKGTFSDEPDKPVFGISVAEKSSLWLKLDLKFKSFGHGAAPPDQYANKHMLRALDKLSNVKTNLVFNTTNRRMFYELGEITGGVKGFVYKNINWWVFRPILKAQFAKEPMAKVFFSNTVMLTNIYNPPGPFNQIPNEVTAYLDCRLQPGTNIKGFIRDIKFGLLNPKFNITVIDASPEAPESKPDKYFNAMSLALKQVHGNVAVVPILFPATTDNNFFRAKGIPAFGIIPSILSKQEMESIHNVNEKIRIVSLYNGIATYKNFLEQLLNQQMSAEK